MILSGWNYTYDVQKAERWAEFVQWADDRCLLSLLPDPTRDAFYSVEHPTSYDIGPGGGPCYLPWSFTPKDRPSAAAVSDALNRIQTQWSEIVEPRISHACRPERFTGRKYRALLVVADPTVTPPWGDWHAITWRGDARSFTRLRAAINELIQPHHVDHVNFRLEAPRGPLS